jgi:hypothetical protein
VICDIEMHVSISTSACKQGEEGKEKKRKEVPSDRQAHSTNTYSIYSSIDFAPQESLYLFTPDNLALIHYDFGHGTQGQPIDCLSKWLSVSLVSELADGILVCLEKAKKKRLALFHHP